MEQNTEKLVLELKTDAKDYRPVYVSGNFNGWRTNDSTFKMEVLEPGLYRFVFPENLIRRWPIEYKYVRGSWDSEELNELGSRIPNRIIRQRSGIIYDQVPQWEPELQFDRRFLPKIKTISDNFEIPQLIRTRRIAALLPYDYDEQEHKRYPVLYLQDGQNLYDDHAPFGNWAVDKRLALMAEKRMHELIVISIDHAKEDRIKEFTPSHGSKIGQGEGKKYARFLADTLKPYVDNRLRTLPDRQHTGIGGSSMGGLISIYSGLMYPEIYSKLMIFSPSLWVAPHIHFHYLKLHEAFHTKIYLYGGEQESSTMVPNLKRFKRSFSRQGFDNNLLEFKLAIDPNGKHSESFWGEAFPGAVEWLFFTKTK